MPCPLPSVSYRETAYPHTRQPVVFCQTASPSVSRLLPSVKIDGDLSERRREAASLRGKETGKKRLREKNKTGSGNGLKVAVGGSAALCKHLVGYIYFKFIFIKSYYESKCVRLRVCLCVLDVDPVWSVSLPSATCMTRPVSWRITRHGGSGEATDLALHKIWYTKWTASG